MVLKTYAAMITNGSLRYPVLYVQARDLETALLEFKIMKPGEKILMVWMGSVEENYRVVFQD